VVLRRRRVRRPSRRARGAATWQSASVRCRSRSPERSGRRAGLLLDVRPQRLADLVVGYGRPGGAIPKLGQRTAQPAARSDHGACRRVRRPPDVA
jgi:hypothetical protein